MSVKHRFATEEIENFSTVDLITELKRRYQVLSRPERSCVLLGAPSSGISTQANFLRKEWGLCSIKRKDILPRPDNSLESAISRLSEEISSFRCRRGFVLENFPISPDEAAAFDALIANKHVSRQDYRAIVLDVPHSSEQEKELSEKWLISRAKGLLLHPSSGRRYNTNVPDLTPQVANVDDVTGEALVCPNFDISTLRDQIRSWWDKESQTLPILGQRVSRIDALKSIDSVSMDISRVLLEVPQKLKENVSGTSDQSLGQE